jgi:O-antigen ligase
MENQKFMQKHIDRGIFMIILAMPISLVLNITKNGAIFVATKIPVVDIAVWLVFVIWVYQLIVSKECHEATLPPAPLSAYFMVAVLSIGNSINLLNSVKETIQVLGYFLCSYMIFINNIKTQIQLKKIICVISVVTTLVIIYGIYQSIVLNKSTYLLSSVFDNRNVLGGYLAVVLPVFFAFILNKSSTGTYIWFGLIVLAGLVIITSIPSFISLGIVFVFIGFLQQKKWWYIAGIISVFIIIIILPVGIRLSDVKNPHTFLFEPNDLDEYHGKVIRSVQMSYVGSIIKGNIGDYEFHILSNIITKGVIPEDYVRQMLMARKKDYLYGDGNHVNQIFLEWQAALNVLADKPFFGLGIGNYQQGIGFYYNSLPKLNTTEPDSQNGYLINSVTMGIFGLAILFWITTYFGRLVLNIYLSTKNNFYRNLSIGLFGSLIAFCLNNFFSPILYNAGTMLFVLILSLINMLNTNLIIKR